MTGRLYPREILFAKKGMVLTDDKIMPTCPQAVHGPQMTGTKPCTPWNA